MKGGFAEANGDERKKILLNAALRGHRPIVPTAPTRWFSGEMGGTALLWHSGLGKKVSSTNYEKYKRVLTSRRKPGTIV
jgi:hypothetical protein